MDVNIKATTCFKKHIKANKRFIVSQGASRSGKSYALAQTMTIKALEKKRIITIVMEYLPVLITTILRDLNTIILNSELKNICKYNKSKHTFNFINGSIIELRAFNNEPSRALGGSRDILWVDEADNIPYDLFSQLAIRTTENIYISYNPRSLFWVNDKIMDAPEYKDQFDFIHTTYKDNEYVPPEQIEEIKRRSERDENFKKVYLLGEVGAKLDLVYDKYNVIEYIPESITGKYIQYVGLDFGWTDPTALVECFIVPDKNGNIDEIYINELLYLPQISNRNLKNHIRLHTLNKYLCVADSASPQNIDELKRYGVNIDGVKKGPDSISYGISVLKSAKLHITENSINILKEIKNYSYLKDRNDNYVLDKNGRQIPRDDFNHAMDAIRYTALYYVDNKLRSNKNAPLPSPKRRGLLAY